MKTPYGVLTYYVLFYAIFSCHISDVTLLFVTVSYKKVKLVKSQRCFGCTGDLHHSTYFSFFNFPIVVPREKQIETMDFLTSISGASLVKEAEGGD